MFPMFFLPVNPYTLDIQYICLYLSHNSGFTKGKILVKLNRQKYLVFILEGQT